MRRMLWLCAPALLVACASTRPVLRPVAPEGIGEPWRALHVQCNPAKGADGKNYVSCPLDEFREGLLGCSRLGREFEKCLADRAADGSVSEVDVAECQMLVAECERKLDSPWRSWWLWSLIGAAVASAVWAGLHWGE